jgi:hypothetical protein
MARKVSPRVRDDAPAVVFRTARPIHPRGRRPNSLNLSRRPSIVDRIGSRNLTRELPSDVNLWLVRLFYHAVGSF